MELTECTLDYFRGDVSIRYNPPVRHFFLHGASGVFRTRLGLQNIAYLGLITC